MTVEIDTERDDRWVPVEPEFLAEGVYASHALLQVAAGPDVSEEGHAVRLRFIRTVSNTNITPIRGAG